MREIDFAMKRYPGLKPAVLLSYDREAFYAKNDHEFRMTFDENILWRDTDLSLCSPIGGTPLLAPDQVLLEVKTAGAIPLWLVHLFSEQGIRKTSFSKYGTAYRSIFTQQKQQQAALQPNTEPTVDGGIYKYA